MQEHDRRAAAVAFTELAARRELEPAEWLACFSRFALELRRNGRSSMLASRNGTARECEQRLAS